MVLLGTPVHDFIINLWRRDQTWRRGWKGGMSADRCVSRWVAGIKASARSDWGIARSGSRWTPTHTSCRRCRGRRRRRRRGWCSLVLTA